MNSKIETLKEISIEKKLRKNFLLIPLATFFIAIILILSIGHCMNLYTKGYYWAVIPASFFAHSFLIITVHDGSHKAITRTKYDRLIINICSALLFLPFYGEHYRKYHLLHHGNTNTDLDPITPPILKQMFTKHRYLYIISEAIPLLFTSYLIFDYAKRESARHAKNSLKINKKYFVLSIFITIIWVFLIQPPLYFVLFTFLLLNIISVIRNWCEHMGTSLEYTTNTYWFPLGFGIGNHDIHHRLPNLSWLSLAIGLMYREKNTNPIKALKGILFDKTFSFYKSK